MHILTLTPFYPSAADDAAGCFIAESVKAMDERDVYCSVIAVQPLYRPHQEPNGLVPKAVWVHYFCLPGNQALASSGWFLYLGLVSQVLRIHLERPIDLIHAHGALPCGHAAMLLARKLDIPFVVTVHGLDAFSTRQVPGWFGTRCESVSRRLYRTASQVICISDHVRQIVVEGTEGTAKTVVTYNGADPNLFAPAHDDNFSEMVVLSIGNLIPIKGHGLLLRAMGVLKNKHPELQCWIIGEGPELASLRALARTLDIESRVRFFGRRSRAEVADAMRRSTVFALPSRYEALGCVYLEAMSAEKPAIACRGQGIEEIIQHSKNGWLVGPDNLEELVSGLSVLLQDPAERQRIGRAGRVTILRGLTLAHQAERLKAVYKECFRWAGKWCC